MLSFSFLCSPPFYLSNAVIRYNDMGTKNF